MSVFSAHTDVIYGLELLHSLAQALCELLPSKFSLDGQSKSSWLVALPYLQSLRVEILWRVSMYRCIASVVVGMRRIGVLR